MPVDAGMAETKPGTCLSHHPRDEELPINHLASVPTALRHRLGT